MTNRDHRAKAVRRPHFAAALTSAASVRFSQRQANALTGCTLRLFAVKVRPKQPAPSAQTVHTKVPSAVVLRGQRVHTLCPLRVAPLPFASNLTRHIGHFVCPRAYFSR
ncbi:MAG: hypothetical protein KBS47_03805 [Bacteroidales bacterium]|nr:hypothetical protein [Candidatus Equimonas enterica]